MPLVPLELPCSLALGIYVMEDGLFDTFLDCALLF